MRSYNSYLFSLLVLISIFLGSCQTEYHVHFNRDFSGSQTITIDMSQMAGFFGDAADGNEIMNDDTLRMMVDSLSAAFAGTGADNFIIDVSEQDDALVIGFDFKDLKTFDNIAAALEEEGLGQDVPQDKEALFTLFGSSFEKNGKWLTIPLGESGLVLEMTDALNSTDEDVELESEDEEDFIGSALMSGMMGEAMTIKHRFSFDRKIKKIKADVPYLQDGKTLIVEYSIDDFVKWREEGKKCELQVKLK